MLFYVIMVLFSSQIGFDIIIWIDIFCQIANVVITMLVRIPIFRTLFVAQAGTFVYGIANATSNVFHSYAYCVFEKDMFVRISGWTRGATLLGHLLGSAVGGLVWRFTFEELKNLKKISAELVKNYQPDAFYSFYKTVSDKLTSRLFNGTVYMLGFTVLFMLGALVVSMFFPKLSKEAKRKSRKSVSDSLKSMYYATHEFKNRSVAFWAMAWTLSFMSMLYSKQWCPNLWKYHQERLSASLMNSAYDGLAYMSGAIGSFVPGYVTKHLGFQGSVAVQLLITALGALLAFCQFLEWKWIEVYYACHILFSFVIYYSMAFQSGELARSIAHDKIKPIFYILNASTFLFQYLLNIVLEGLDQMPSVDFVFKYLIMTGFMIFNFILVFIGFSGAKREHRTEEKEVEQISKPSTPVANVAVAADNADKEEEGEENEKSEQ